ncbi:MAG: hypothetical protein IKQ27_01555 [Lachnospiraceae bacterium]|nr:hypothetical protein [Lachnospiraceae bacterium]
MSSKSEKTKENAKGILKPLAAAFFATEPEEDDKLLTPKPVAVKKAPSKSIAKEPDPMLGELSTEEARALLKEQLVGRISTEIGTKKEAPKKASAGKDTEAKKDIEATKTEIPSAKEIAKKVSKIENKIDSTANGKAAAKEPVKESAAKEGVAKGSGAKESAAKAVSKKTGNTEKKAAAPVKEKAAKPAPKAEKKEAPVQAPSVQEEIHMEYAGKSYDMDTLVAKAVQVWTSVYKRSRRELWSVELYVKPEESKAYYVLNKRKNGSIDL